MQTTITTTIVTTLDLDTFDPTYTVDIEADDDGLPSNVILAAATGAVKATLRTLEARTNITVSTPLDDDKD